MIPVDIPDAETALTKRTRDFLNRRQTSANQLDSNSVETAWNSFRRTRSGEEVVHVLSGFFNGKCAYCEQESAKDVEHFYPKTKYQGRMFTWRNFLWCCKNCNTEKLAEFPLDAGGHAIILNPTIDDPLDYLCWDELSGKIVPHPDPVRGDRAISTRDMLALDQFSLSDERRNKLANVVYLLSRVISEQPIRPDTIERLRAELAPHRPWLGMIRQLFRRPSPRHRPLVREARRIFPELDKLISPWIGPTSIDVNPAAS